MKHWTYAVALIIDQEKPGFDSLGGGRRVRTQLLFMSDKPDENQAIGDAIACVRKDDQLKDAVIQSYLIQPCAYSEDDD